MFHFRSCARFALPSMLVVLAAICNLQWGHAQEFDPFGDAAADPFAEPVGQAPAKQKEKPPEPRTAQRFSASQEEIVAALEKPITLKMVDVPLGEAAAFIRDHAKINVELDTRGLEDVGIDKETPVTLSTSEISLRSALRLLLKQLDLTFDLRGNSLLITTPEAVESELTIKVYPVGWLRKSDPLVDERDWTGDDLMEVVTSVVRPTTWEHYGGPGSIVFLRDKLIVSQTDEVQQEVAEVLQTLEEAQEIIAAADGKPPKVTSLPALKGRHADIEKALASEVKCDFKETPLKDVAAFFAEAKKINILLDHRALEDVGIGADTPITRKVKGVSLRSALRLILGEMECTYVVRDEVLLITTPEEAEAELVTRIYPVHDLVFPQNDGLFAVGPDSADYDSLIELITSLVGPAYWEEVGGAGAIESYDGCLIISQIGEVFAEIDNLLAGIRLIKGQYEADTKRVLAKSVRIDELPNPNVVKLRKALDGDVGMVAFARESLTNVAQTLASKHDVPILIDHRALDDIGVDAGTTLTATLGGERLSEALSRLLKPLDLVWTVRNECIFITSPEEAENELQTRIYPVRDLVLPDGEGAPLEAKFDPASSADYDTLRDTVLRSVQPTTWEDVGGPGATESYPACFGLVVSQTEAVHAEIDDLLAQVREVDRAQAKEKARPKPADDDAKDGEIRKDKTGAKLHLKVYRLSNRDREEAGELAEAIRELVEPDSWEADKAYYLKPLTGAIIVRQRAEAHRKIHRLLTELDVLAWPTFGEGDGSAFGTSGFGGGGLGGGGLGGGGLGGGVFAVPDNIQGQLGGFGWAQQARDPARSQTTTISSLSIAADEGRPAMPLAIYRLKENSREDAREIAQAIKELVEPDGWKGETGAYLRSIGGKLIIRHNKGVHRRIYRLLLELDAIERPAREMPWQGGGIPVVG